METKLQELQDVVIDYYAILLSSNKLNKGQFRYIVKDMVDNPNSTYIYANHVYKDLEKRDIESGICPKCGGDLKTTFENDTYKMECTSINCSDCYFIL